MNDRVTPEPWSSAAGEAPGVHDALEHLPDAVFMLDAGNAVTWSNAAGRALFAPDTAIGAELTSLALHSAEAAGSPHRALPAMLARVRASGAERQSFQLGPADDDSRPVEVSLSPATSAPDSALICFIRDASELAQVRASMAQLRDELDDVERIAQVGHWRRDLSTRRFEWSEGTFRILGADPNLEQDVRSVMRNTLHPDDSERVGQHYQRCLDLGEPFDMEFRLVLRDGTVRWVHCCAETTYDRTGEPLRSLGTIIDITARKAFEDRLRASEERFALAMRGANDGVWDWDLVTDDVYYSPRWLSMLGYEPGDWPYRLETWASLVHKEDRDVVLELVEAYLDERADSFEVEQRMRHRDGHEVVVLARALKVVDDDGVPIRLVGTHVDISERKHYEDQLRESQKMEAVGRLVGGIAHDFNNVLAAIQGNVHLAGASAGNSPRVTAKLHTIDQLVGRAAKMVGQLLTFARRDSVQKSTFSLVDTLRESYALAGTAVSDDIDHEVSFGDVPLPVHGNAVQIQQVLLNLLSNAVDAVGEAAAPRIRVRASLFQSDARFERAHPSLVSGRYARLEVEDNGHGIDEADMENIFDPFFTTKEVGRGTGLGLATAFGAVRSHGGVIEVQSTPGEGTCFSVYLPLSETPLEPDEDTRHDLVRGRGETLMLVDDDPAVRKATGALLRTAGYTVIEAGNGEQALRLFKDFATEIDLVMTDVVMPRKGGVALRDALRVRAPSLPIILITGYDRERVLDPNDATPLCESVTKPFRLEHLTTLVRELIDASRAERAVAAADRTAPT